MRRTMIAVIALLFPSSSFAGLDGYTAWMSGQPLSRLDWFVLNAKTKLGADLKADNPNKRYESAIKGAGIIDVEADVHYAFDSNTFTILIVSLLIGKVTPEACRVMVEQTRDVAVYQGSHGFFYEPKTPAMRLQYTVLYVGSMLSTPSGLTVPTTEPRDLQEQVARKINIQATLMGSDVQSVTCSGSFLGDEVNLQIK